MTGNEKRGNVYCYKWQHDAIQKTADKHGVSMRAVVAAAIRGNPYPLVDFDPEGDLHRTWMSYSLTKSEFSKLREDASSAGRKQSNYVLFRLFGDVVARRGGGASFSLCVRPWQYEAITRTAQSQGLDRTVVVRTAIQGNPFSLEALTVGAEDGYKEIKVTLTDSEKDGMCSAAHASGLSVQNYCRSLIFGTSVPLWKHGRTLKGGPGQQSYADSTRIPISFRAWQLDVMYRTAEAGGMTLKELVYGVLTGRQVCFTARTMDDDELLSGVRITFPDSVLEPIRAAAQEAGIGVGPYIRGLLFEEDATSTRRGRIYSGVNKEFSFSLRVGELRALKQVAKEGNVSVPRLVARVLTKEHESIVCHDTAGTEILTKSLSLPADLLIALRNEAKAEGLNLSALIRSRIFARTQTLPLTERTP